MQIYEPVCVTCPGLGASKEHQQRTGCGKLGVVHRKLHMLLLSRADVEQLWPYIAVCDLQRTYMALHLCACEADSV